MTKTKKQPKKNDETDVETTQENIESTQEKDESPLSQNDETDEDDEDDETDEDDEEDNVSSVDLNTLIHMRIYDGLSFREIAKRQNLSLSMVARVLKGVDPQGTSKEIEAETKPQIPIQAEDQSDLDEEIVTVQQNPIISSSIITPSGRIEIPPQLWDQLDDLDKKSVKGWKTNVLAWNDLQKQNRNNGHGSFEGHSNNGYGETYIDALGRLVDKIAMQKQAEKIVDKVFPSEKNDGLERKFERLEDKIEKLGSPKEGNTEKTLDVLAKIYDRASGQNQTNPFQVAQSILTLTKEQANIAKGSTNEFDLKHLEMQQLGKLEDQKLAWEIEKYRDEKQGSADTINAIKDILKTVGEGPIGKVISDFGGVAADRVRGTPKMSSIDVQCPNCRNRWKANPDLDILHCPNCGAGLQKRAQPTEPQLQPEATQPSPTEQPEVQEQKPELDRWSPQEREAYRSGEKTDSEVI